MGHTRSAWFVIIGIITYTIFVGADAAVVRAAIMAVILVVAARLMGRPTFAPAGLFSAALVMTLINPTIIYDVGFQLSFAATLGLMIYIDPWKAWVETGTRNIVSPALAKRLVRFFGDIFIPTLAEPVGHAGQTHPTRPGDHFSPGCFDVKVGQL